MDVMATTSGSTKQNKACWAHAQNVVKLEGVFFMCVFVFAPEKIYTRCRVNSFQTSMESSDQIL